jgi:hypothetical protein
MRFIRLYVFGSGLLIGLFISGHAMAEMYKIAVVTLSAAAGHAGCWVRL